MRVCRASILVLQILTAASHVVTRLYMDPATHAHTSLEVDSYIRSKPWRMKNDTNSEIRDII